MGGILTASHVSKVYASKTSSAGFSALHDVSLEVRENEFVSIVGPSGCGKSTLLSIMGGFEKPTSGSVHFDGAVIDGPSRDRGFVFQADALFHWLTVEQNVAYGLRVQGYGKARQREIVDDSLRLVGLTKFRSATPGQLSGGMRQRVAIARALATDPRILLLDEPFGALDVLTRKKMQDELARIWDRTHKTVVLVTHAIDEALLLSDRIVVMTKSPGVVRHSLTVELERPRSARDERFRELELSISELLMNELEDETT
jgi:ABC-type nitrate/sulfonate/bicarbonate transport system ATPase subunit